MTAEKLIDLLAANLSYENRARVLIALSSVIDVLDDQAPGSAVEIEKLYTKLRNHNDDQLHFEAAFDLIDDHNDLSKADVDRLHAAQTAAYRERVNDETDRLEVKLIVADLIKQDETGNEFLAY